MIRTALAIAAAGVTLVALFNASAFAPAPDHGPRLLAHRGVHQQFSRIGLDNDTCTAARIFAPTHDYLENTIASIDAAFKAGADMVEIDIHPTTDGDFAVFHDWTLDCRTNGSGVTREQTMASLRTLDVGYGYTADGGATFPFRGKGVGLMPSLLEMLAAFPGRAFLVNVKSNDASEADLLFAYLSAHGEDRPLAIFAGPRFAERWRALGGGAPVFTKAEGKACAMAYVLTGWSGRIPEPCRGVGIGAPADLAFLYWGYPRRLVARFETEGLGVILVGPLSGPSDGIDSVEALNKIPRDYAGWISTNRIEVIGPAIKARSQQ